MTVWSEIHLMLYTVVGGLLSQHGLMELYIYCGTFPVVFELSADPPMGGRPVRRLLIRDISRFALPRWGASPPGKSSADGRNPPTSLQVENSTCDVLPVVEPEGPVLRPP